VENKDQNNPFSMGVEPGVTTSVVDVPQELNSLSAEPEVQVPLASQERMPNPLARFFKATRRLDVVLGLLLIIGVGVAVFVFSQRSSDGNNTADVGADKYGTIELPLNEIIADRNLTIAGSSNVTINGQLQLSDSVYLLPGLQPTGAKAGQIYYDKNTNQLAYFNGEQFVFLTSPSADQGNIQVLTGVESLAGVTGDFTLGQGLALNGTRLDNTGVLQVQGQGGDITLTAGPGIVINGTNFSNTGVLRAVSGGANVDVTTDADGTVTISVDDPTGTGTVASGGGTIGAIPVFTGSQNIEDSIITQSGLTITISGDLSVVTGGLSLSTALTVSNGGTGADSLSANGVLVGNGTAPVSSIAAGGAGLCLLSTAGAPVWAACPSGSGVTSLNSLTGSLNIANASAAGSTVTIDDASTVTKGIASYNGTNFTVSGGIVDTIQDIDPSSTPTFAGVNTNTITPSAALTVGISAQAALLQGSTTTITSNGAGNDIILNAAGTIELQDNTNVTGNASLTGDIAVNGGDITSSGALNITPGGALTVGATNQALTLQGGPTTTFRSTSGSNTTVIGFTSPTANTTLNFPALAAGTYTICTTSGNCSGAASTLQSTYDNSSNPELILDATRGALTIRDNAVALGANLLEVQNNTGSSTYLAVTASGIAVTGTASVSGNINTSAGALQTNGTTRIDNSGNGINLGSLSLSGTISGGTTITGSGNINTTGGVIQTNSTTRIDNTGNLVNIAALTAGGDATFQGGNVTLGTGSQAGTVVLNDGSSNTGILQVAALGQDTVYTLPDPGTGSATVCLNTGNCAGTGGGVTTGGGTTNRLPRFTGAQTVGDSSISDDGTNVTVSIDVVIQGGDLTVGSTSQAASIVLNDGNGQTTTLQAGNSAGNMTFILPTNTGGANQCLKQSGTGNQLIWQDCDGGSGGSSATLQTAYNNSTNPEITLNSSVGGLTIRDSSTPLGANLFEIQNNLGNTTYLAVTVSGLGVTGSVSASGNINTSGGALQTNGTSRVDNSGNLVNIGNITGTGAVTIASVGAGNDITIDGADEFIVQDMAVFNATTTFNADIDLGANDIVGTTGNIDLSNFDVVGATGNITAGTYNGQTISSSASFTGTVAVAGDTTLAGDIAVNGGDITAAGALNITPGGPLTVGISAQTALLQGSTTTITSNGAGNDIILNAAGTIELLDDTNVTGNLSLTGDITIDGGDIVSGGALNVTPAGTLTLGSTSQALFLQGDQTTTMTATSGANTTTLAFTNPVANTTLNFPALAAGTYTICTTSGNCSGAAATLQSSYDNSGTPEIVLDATRGALTIRDNAVALGANLLEVQNNTGATTYFGVTASGVAITGTATVSGNINTTGGVIQTNSTTRIDNSGNLINIASVTAGGNATFQGGGLTLGTGSQAGSIVLNDGSSNTGTLQVAALGQNTVYTLPDPGTGSATICLTTGNCAGVAGGVTTPGGTTNRLPKFTNSQEIGDSSISDDGSNVTVDVDVIVQGGDLTLGATSQAASIVMHDGSGQTTTLQAGNSAGNLTFILPTNAGVANQCLKQSGTGNQLIWQDCDGGAGGSSATLQTTYNNSLDPEIVLNSSVGGLTIRDSSTPLGANLFEIQNNLGSTTYLSVAVTGVSVTGTASATGNINTTGGALQTNGTSRIDNSGNLVNIGNITGTGAVTVASVGAGNDISVDGADRFIVQDIADFNALTNFNANIDIGANDIIGTTADINLSNFDVVGATGNVTAGTYNGQTISSSASFTGSVTVATNLTLTSGDIAVNGGDITSTGALNITPGGTLTVGTTGQQLVLQGNASTRLTATGNGFTTTVGFGGVPTGAVTYNFDRAAAAGTYSICTSVGNCAGVGGGVTTTGGTTGTFAKFTGAQTLGDSLLSESGSVVTVNGNLNLTGTNQYRVNGTQISSANLSNDANLAKLGSSQTFTGNTVAFQNGTNSTNAFNVQNAAGSRVLTVDTTAGQVVLGVGSTVDGKLVFNNVSNGNTVTVLPGSPSADRTLTLPDASGIICTDSGNCAGAGSTLQTGYNFSVGGTTPKIKVNSTLLGVDIQDADTTIGANLFNVRASNAAGLGSVMFGVSSTGVVTLQNASNSTAAFRLLTQGGTSVLTGDTQNGAVYLGQSGTLSGSLGFRNATNSNTVTLTTATASGDRTITLPDDTGTVCLDSGNCVGVGGGVTTSGGTTNRVPIFSGSQTLANSWLLQNTSTLELDSTRSLSLLGGNLSVTGNITTTGTYNSNTFTSTSLQFSSAGSATISSAASQALTVTSNAAATWSTTSGNLSIQAQGNLNLGNGGGQTINIGNNASSHTISIGTSTTGTQTVTIGSTGGASATTVQGGTGNLNLTTNSASASVIVRSNTNGTNAFQIQDAASSTVFGVNTSTRTVSISGNFTFAGVQPASVTGNGTSGGVSSLLAAAGGNTTGVTGQTAGNGGSLFIDGGAGGNAPSGSANGWGGNVFIAGGAPGSGAGSGGLRGNVILQGSAGVVGIGTFSPGGSYKLDVAGDINISSGSNFRINGAAICYSGGCDTSLQRAYNGSLPTDEIVLNSINGALAIRQDAGSAVTTFFEVTDNAGTNPYLRVDTAGILTNGNINALSNTVIAAAFRSGVQTAASSNSNATTFSSGQVSGATSNSGAVTLQSGASTTSGSTGNVTIISGTASSGNSGNIAIDSGGASGTRGTITLGATNTSSITLGRTTANATIAVNGVTVFKTASANSPNAFDVQDSTSDSLLKVDTTNDFVIIGHESGTLNGANAGLLIGDTCGSTLSCISMFEGSDINDVGTGDTDVMQLQGMNGLRFSTGSTLTSRMVINASGNVGIGTEDATERLTVQGNMSVLANDGSKGYRFRTSGGSLDLEASGVGVPGELWMSGWTGANFTGTQVNWFRMNASSRLVMVGAGAASTTPTLLVLDRKSTSGDPGGYEGGMYYNDATDRFRCYQNGQWEDCVGETTIGWTNVPLTANASDGGSGTSMHRVRKLASGQVELQFDVDVNAAGSLGTLPTWARPTAASFYRFPVATTASGSTTFNAHIDLTSAGAVNLVTSNVASMPWLSVFVTYTP
jgi:fibronectin-binding autotransporter adhesin